MDDLETKMGAVLNNPEAMQKIMALAQSLNLSGMDNSQTQSQKSDCKETETSKPALPALDLSMIQKLTGLAGQQSINKNEQTLLKALGPYLSRERIFKLEKAMRAAKMARMASSILGNIGPQSNPGR